MEAMRLLVIPSLLCVAASGSSRSPWSSPEWEASHKHVGSCRCSGGDWGIWGQDNGCYRQADVSDGPTLCAPPAGPEYHPSHIDVESMVAALPQTDDQHEGLTFENGDVIGFIENQLNPGQCLDVKDGTDYLQMHPCEFNWNRADTDQIWKIRPNGFIENVKYPGMCIDVIGNPALYDQDRAQLHYCEFGWQLNDQQWQLTAQGFLKNRLNPSKCLDVEGVAQTKEDSAIVMYECDELFASHPEFKVTDQTWKLVSIPSPDSGEDIPTPVPPPTVVFTPVPMPSSTLAPAGSGAVAPAPNPGTPDDDGSASVMPTPWPETTEQGSTSVVPAPAQGSSQIRPSPAPGPASVPETSEEGSSSGVPAPVPGSSQVFSSPTPSPASVPPASAPGTPKEGFVLVVPAPGSASSETVSSPAPSPGPIVPTPAQGQSEEASGSVPGTSQVFPSPGTSATSDGATSPAITTPPTSTEPPVPSSQPSEVPEAEHAADGQSTSIAPNSSPAGEATGSPTAEPEQSGGATPTTEPGQSAAGKSTSDVPSGATSRELTSTLVPNTDNHDSSAHGRNVVGTTPGPDGEQIDGHSVTSAPHQRKETQCICADNSVGAMDDSTFLCMKGGAICSRKTTVFKEEESPFLSWYFWAIVILIIGLSAAGTAYLYGVKPFQNRKRDLELSPGGSSLNYDDEDEASDEEAQMGFATVE